MRYHDLIQLMEIADTVRKKVADQWKKELPTLTDQQINYYLDRWDRFAPAFDPQFRDITRLTFRQVERLIDDAQTRADLKGRNKIKNQGNREDNLVSEDDLIYNRNGLVILLGDLQEKCIRYGDGYNWCISRQDASNMFYNYRFGDKDHDQPVFYFVFDKTLPKENVWHAAVIFVDIHGIFHVDTASNTGDRRMTWDQIAAEQPRLARLKHLFQPQPIEDSERAEYAKYGNQVDTKTYANWSMAEKYKYIQFGHNLSDEQLAVTPRDLIPVYVKLNPLHTTPELERMLNPSDRRALEKTRIRAATNDTRRFIYALNFGFKPSEEVQKAAVTADIDVIEELVQSGINLSQSVQMTAVTSHKKGLEMLINVGIKPSKSVAMAAVKSRYPYYALSVLEKSGFRITDDLEQAAEQANINNRSQSRR